VRLTCIQSRNYNLNLSQADLEAAIVSDVQAEIERRKSERAFKYIMIVAVIVLMLMISVLMVGWEFGYFSSDQSYSAPIYY
jgi:heme/copper-type cytochrome/quinol oxidase subunit 2